MKVTARNLAGLACLIVVTAALVMVLAPRVAANPTTLAVCVNPGNGDMRLGNSSAACHDM